MMLAVSYCYCSDWVSAEERTVVFAYLQICGWVANIIAPMTVGNSKLAMLSRFGCACRLAHLKSAHVAVVKLLQDSRVGLFSDDYLGALRGMLLIFCLGWLGVCAFIACCLPATPPSRVISSRTTATTAAVGGGRAVALGKVLREGNPIALLVFVASNRLICGVVLIFLISHFQPSSMGVFPLYLELLFGWEACDSDAFSTRRAGSVPLTRKTSLCR